MIHRKAERSCETVSYGPDGALSLQVVVRTGWVEQDRSQLRRSTLHKEEPVASTV